MSETLARIRVREPHGIRRFLYPLTAGITLPSSIKDAALVTADGQPVPSQLLYFSKQRYRLDFAVSLAPGASQEYLLVPGSAMIVNDPLHIQPEEVGILLHSRQERFEIALLDDARIDEVVYDGVSHLRAALMVERVGHTHNAEPPKNIAHRFPHDRRPKSDVTLSAWGQTMLRYEDGVRGSILTSITACKSWATVALFLDNSATNEEVVFTLPFAASSSTLIYDLGVEGVYGKLEREKTDSVHWRMTRGDGESIDWTVALNERLDYVGRMTQSEFGYKRWFHLVDGDKAIAVAITSLPTQWRAAEACLTSHGDIQVIFRQGPQAEQAAIFGVCYHFLNNVPAIAAATNPQSILLPPTVEVLPP